MTNTDARTRRLPLLYGAGLAIVASGVWLTVGPMLYRALLDLPSLGTVQAACIAVVLCVGPVAPLGLLTGVHDSLVHRGRLDRRDRRAALWLGFGHLLVAAGIIAALAAQHGGPLAVLFAGLVFIPEALTVGLVRLTWTTAD
ncbi:hypothetical protein [Streptomyces sp. NPDC058847]|uniref:hypothetical protein n=1 Tax=Streptomyces sp. NPDC058847 TaxID=3346649 RepID=UPI0036A88992